VATLVTHLFATVALWVRIQTSSQKFKMGDIAKERPTHSGPPESPFWREVKSLNNLIFTYLENCMCRKNKGLKGTVA
jgi:hypothetical protein